LVSISDAATEMNGPDKAGASSPELNICFVGTQHSTTDCLRAASHRGPAWIKVDAPWGAYNMAASTERTA